MEEDAVGEMNGKDYRARVEITLKGGVVVAAVGETCERVDPAALGWLLQCDAIELAPIEPAESENV